METRGMCDAPYMTENSIKSCFQYMCILFELWDDCHIGIPWHDKDCNDAVILGFLVAIFLQKVLFLLLMLYLHDDNDQQ